jgi:hypothetical protein
VEEATKIGIKTTTEVDYNYLESKAIYVTVIHTLVNGYSRFSENGKNYPIGSIIIDDVHTCMDTVKKQFSLTINSALSEVYEGIINILKDQLSAYDPDAYIDVIEKKDPRKLMLVPFWIWKENYEKIRRLISQFVTTSDNGNEDIFFSWPLVQGVLKDCDCIISAGTIEITPRGINIDKISGFKNAKRRIYMSATLSDDSIFVSTFGLKKEDLANIIVPDHANDMGNRLIIFPQYLNRSISDEDIKKRINVISESYNVVVIVPSFERAKFWDPNGLYTASGDQISQAVHTLKNRKNGLTVIANRYDGIDLPDNACRMLVIDGLPPMSSKMDEYIHGTAPENADHMRQRIQRIEQGMGRGVRSTKDECCIVMMGEDLISTLSRTEGRELFSEATKCQYDISKKLWDIVLTEESKPSIDTIFELADISLSLNEEWRMKGRNALDSLEYNQEPRVDPIVVSLREAFEASLKGLYKEASQVLINSLRTIKDDKTKGYMMQVIASYMNNYNEEGAQEKLVEGKKLNINILTPRIDVNATNSKEDLMQARNVIKFVKFEIQKYTPQSYINQVNNIIDKMKIGIDYKEFEEALDYVGKMIGYDCTRPDKNGSGDGPDNLWIIEPNKYLVIECKSMAQAEKRNKDYCGQLLNSVNWAKKKYPSGIDFQPIIIHPSRIFIKQASPNENTRVMTDIELFGLREKLKGYLMALLSSDTLENEMCVCRLLRMEKFRPRDFVRKYTVNYMMDE